MGKRKRDSTDGASSIALRDIRSRYTSFQKQRFLSIVDSDEDLMLGASSEPELEGSTSTVSMVATKVINQDTKTNAPAEIAPEPSPLSPLSSISTPGTNPGASNSLWRSTSRLFGESSSSNPPAIRPMKMKPRKRAAANPILTGLQRPQTQPQPQPSVRAVTPHENPEQEQSTTASTNEVDRTDPSLTAFLERASPFKPLGFFARDLQKAGISTTTELRIIARDPEAFRTKITVLANLREREEYLWFMFWRGLQNLLEVDHMEQSANDLPLETDPIRKFVRSLGGGKSIDSEVFADGLKGAGISSERDLLVLSRNLEKYTKYIPFLREFAASRKFGWAIFQVGLEGLADRRASTSTHSQDPGTSRGNSGYIRRFLDTIDADKPLGHLAGGFVKAGLDSRIPLLHAAENIETTLKAMPSLQGLASGDQLVWAMILVGLDNLVKSS